MKKRKFRCVLFDLDDTLISTGGAGSRALEKAFLKLYKIPHAVDNINPAGKTDPAIIREMFLNKFGRDCTREEMQAMQLQYLCFLQDECKNADKYQVITGIPKIFNRLEKESFVFGLGTGNIERGARIKLKRARLNRYLPFGGFGSDSEERSELLLVGRRRAQDYAGCEIAPEEMMVVGDTERDIWAAKKAKFKVLAVATGSTPEKTLKDHDPDYFLPGFEDEEKFMQVLGDHAG